MNAPSFSAVKQRKWRKILNWQKSRYHESSVNKARNMKEKSKRKNTMYTATEKTQRSGSLLFLVKLVELIENSVRLGSECFLKINYRY
jgi:hypothetical protein